MTGPLGVCPEGFGGIAEVERVPDGVRWVRADLEIHAADEVIELAPFLVMYEVVSRCAVWPGTWHARRLPGMAASPEA